MKACELIDHPNFGLMKQSDVVSFYHMQMPRWLFADTKYSAMSLEAKVAYTFLLNRFQLSRVNGWVNGQNEVFIIFPREALAREMQISYRKAIESFKELAAANLIWEKRCGRGNANQIYLARVVLSEPDAMQYRSAPFTDCSQEPEASDETRTAKPACLDAGNQAPQQSVFTHQGISAAHHDMQEPHVQTCGTGTSVPAQPAVPDLRKPHNSKSSPRKIHKSQIGVSQSMDAADGKEELEEILENCELQVFPDNVAKVFRHAIERLYYAAELKIGNAILPRESVRSRLWDLDDQVLQEAYHKLKANTERPIKNSIGYVSAVIFNAITEVESDLLVDPYLNSFKSS